jgi:hypothetical protein
VCEGWRAAVGEVNQLVNRATTVILLAKNVDALLRQEPAPPTNALLFHHHHLGKHAFHIVLSRCGDSPYLSSRTTITASTSKSVSFGKKKEEYSDADDESTRGTEEASEDSRPTQELIGLPKAVIKSKDADFQLMKGAIFTDLDEEGVGSFLPAYSSLSLIDLIILQLPNGEQKIRPQEVSPQNYNIIIPSYSAWFSYDR